MKNRYMDFVPARKAKKEIVRKSMPVKVQSKTEIVEETRVSRGEAGVSNKVNTFEDERPKIETRSFLSEKEFKLGVIEDLNPNFAKTEAARQPSDAGVSEKAGLPNINKNESAATKKQGARDENEGIEESKGRIVEEDKKEVFKTPKSPFINQEKIIKRPLSKNVYPKKIEVPKEESKGPIAIIDKPEKDTKVGLVVTIVLTIILGAAAGTVAFLLLPK